jgi:hypothetical protein
LIASVESRVGLGFKIIRYLSDDLFSELGKHGKLECIDGYKNSWALVVKKLSREEATSLYGEVTNEVLGSRGGWKSTTFGKKTFVSRSLSPESNK